VKLLLDENLSPRLVQRLAEAFPGTTHVDAVGFHGRSDGAIWDWARTNEFAIVSKDDDFRQLSFLHGSPPKVIWLSVGNAGTEAITTLLLREKIRVEAFADNPEDSLLILRTT